jgi:delta-aminolevulinic acid dehydratase/porphobilinogen synthase
VLLFGIPEEKDEEGSGAYDQDGIVQRARSRSCLASHRMGTSCALVCRRTTSCSAQATSG